MKIRRPIPRAKELDGTLSLINEGYEFISSRRRALQSDIFETRLIGQKAICMSGEEAAALFYDNDYFKRTGAMPKPIQKTLLGVGGIHGTDGEEHHDLKRMFLSMMTPERLEVVRRMAIEELDKKVDQWEKMDEVVLMDEIEEILTRAVCHWAGLPLKEEEVKQRTQELTAMVDSIGGSLPRYKDGRTARESQESWLKDIIRQTRAGVYNPPPSTPVYIVSHYTDKNGKLLDLHTAAVNLNNAYRPMLATVHFIIFGALAMHQFPETRYKIQADEQNYSFLFSQEVRRFYPFAPAMAAKVKKDFVWHGYHFKENMLVVLDLYGINRHPDSWKDADSFKPERFASWKESPFAFVPQGGGDHHAGHRCAGEWMTVTIMQTFFKYFAENIRYTVPDQDLSLDMARMPTFPESRFRIRNVQKLQATPERLIRHRQPYSVIQT